MDVPYSNVRAPCARKYTTARYRSDQPRPAAFGMSPQSAKGHCGSSCKIVGLEDEDQHQDSDEGGAAGNGRDECEDAADAQVTACSGGRDIAKRTGSSALDSDLRYEAMQAVVESKESGLVGRQLE